MNKKLENYVNKNRFTHISEVEAGFELCENLDDVLEFVGEIPSKFGTFGVLLMDDYGKTYHIDGEEIEHPELITGFQITNFYTDENGDGQEDIWDFGWAC